MLRSNRVALIGAAALLLVAAGTALANRAPSVADDPAAPASSHEAQEVVTAEDLAHAGDRLAASEIPYDDAQLADLAGRYGLGGAVRALAWSHQTGSAVGDITAMRDGSDGAAPMGWGQIAKELGVHPGIGKIMGNGQGQGHGRDGAPGQQKQGTGE